MTAIVAEKWEEAAAREALLDLCMPQRFEKASELIREGRLPADGLALAAHGPDGRMIATVRLWHVSAGPGRPALLLGPLAVHPWFRDRGLGGAMTHAALGRAADLGHTAVILVGDAPYYQRFGFSADKTAGLWMPGPFDPARLLAVELKRGALDGAKGLVSPTGTPAEKPSLADLIAASAEMKRSA